MNAQHYPTIDSGEAAWTVLHVKDDPGFAEMTAAFLERADDRFEVVTAERAAEGLECLEEGDGQPSVGCIVSDYQMPGMDGIAFLEAVRETHPDLPFILFTGEGSETVASDAISAGATDYLQKSGESDQYTLLANRIRNAVETARIRTQRRRLIDAVETAQEGISIYDEEGRFVYVNQAYAELYGYDPEEMIGQQWDLINTDEQLERAEEEILPVLAEEGTWAGETTGLRADGTTFVEDHLLSMTDRGELVCTVRDVTERKEREEALEALQRRTQSLLRTTTPEETGRVAVETASEVLDAPASAFYLCSEDDRRLEPVAALAADEPPAYGRDDDDPVGAAAWEAFERGEPTVVEGGASPAGDTPGLLGPDRTVVAQPLGDHGVFVVPETAADPFTEADRALVDILGNALTTALDRVEREQELKRQNERLDEFASVVSHDLRNPLSIARGRIELASEDCDSPHLTDAAKALSRSEELIDDLLTIAREGMHVDSLETVDLPALARGCWENLEPAGAALDVRTDRVLRADRSRLRQLIENLFRNAVEHGGRDVSVAVDDVADGSGFYVADDGPGIPPAERNRVFDSGYSLADGGSGFGLAIVEQIADAHGWTVELAESADGGARFEITGIEDD